MHFINTEAKMYSNLDFRSLFCDHIKPFIQWTPAARQHWEAGDLIDVKGLRDHCGTVYEIDFLFNNRTPSRKRQTP